MGGGDMIAEVTLDGSTWNDLPYKFEAGTPSIAQAIGLGYAVDYLSQMGMDNIYTHEKVITKYAMDWLSEVPGVTVHGPPAEERGGVAAFTCDTIHPHDLAQVLDAEGVAVRAGHHCAQPLHSCLSIQSTARASFYLYNTLDEVDVFIRSLYKAKNLFSR